MFLRNSAIATTGIALLPSASIANTLTNNKSPFDGYNPFSEEKTDLRISTLFGKHLNIKGKIFDITGSFPLSNAIIEVWHLSPASNKYKHQAKLKTNCFGEYSFITDFPNKEKSKIPRIYFKVSNGNNEYFTELLLNDFGACITGKHWVKNKQLGEKLFPLKTGTLNTSTIVFNLSV
jgi:hypothetical protein